MPRSTGRRIWHFEVTDPNKPPVLSVCQQWILHNSTESFEHDTCLVDICPPSEIFAVTSGWPCIRSDPGFKFRTCYKPWSSIWGGGSWWTGDAKQAKSVRFLFHCLYLFFSQNPGCSHKVSCIYLPVPCLLPPPPSACLSLCAIVSLPIWNKQLFSLFSISETLDVQSHLHPY